MRERKIERKRERERREREREKERERKERKRGEDIRHSWLQSEKQLAQFSVVTLQTKSPQTSMIFIS